MAVADRSARFDGGEHMSVWVTQFHPAVEKIGWPCGLHQRRWWWWLREERRRIRPSRLCASPPFPSQMSIVTGTGQVEEGPSPQAVSIGRFRGGRIRLNPRSSRAPHSIQTPGMEVDHTGGQVKPLSGRMSCVVEEGRAVAMWSCGQP